MKDELISLHVLPRFEKIDIIIKDRVCYY